MNIGIPGEKMYNLFWHKRTFNERNLAFLHKKTIQFLQYTAFISNYSYVAYIYRTNLIVIAISKYTSYE
jgi:hypothetical protein